MQFFNSGVFWFLEGILACLAALGLKVWAEDRGLPMPWWKWLLTGLWVLIFGFSITFVGTNLGEREGQAALLGGVVFGLFSVILGVGLWRLLQAGRRKHV